MGNMHAECQFEVMIYSLKLRNMHAECQFEVMTYISISKRAGRTGKASKTQVELPMRGIKRISVAKGIQSEQHL